MTLSSYKPLFTSTTFMGMTVYCSYDVLMGI